MTDLSVYMTHSNDALSPTTLGFMGAQLPIWDGTQFAQTALPGNAIIQNGFNSTAWLDGVANQNLVANKAHYVYIFDAANPKINFSRQMTPGSRYGFFGTAGIPSYTDAHGNVGTLLGMVLAKDGKIGNVLGGINSRILCSSSPFLSVPQQGLTANSGQTGGTFSNLWSGGTGLAEINSQLGIYACQWAWRGISNDFKGRIADSSTGSPCTVYLQARATSMETGATYDGPLIIHQFAYVGQNTAVTIGGVNLALDDGAYYYTLRGAVSGGAAHIQVQHVLDGWL